MKYPSICILFALIGTAYSATCNLSVPSKNEKGCVTYSLCPLKEQKSFQYTKDNSVYYIRFADNVADVPELCSKLPPSTGYVIKDNVCRSIGVLNTEIIVASDYDAPENGVRIGYVDGERIDEAVTRIFTIDFVCDKNVNPGTIVDLTIKREIFYSFTLATSLACNATYEEKSCPSKPYPETYSALAARPMPKWYDNVKFGIFIHWGLFSVPAFKSEWYYHNLYSSQEAYVKYHNSVYGCSGVAEDKFPCNGKRFSYSEFADMFQAQLFDPEAWAALFKFSGAQYVVLTTKHHDGWCNYPSPQHYLYNSVERGPHRDLTGDLTKAVKNAGLHMGLYHSLKEWDHPLIKHDVANGTSTTFADQILVPSLKQIVNDYKPDVVWSDGPGEDVPPSRVKTIWKSQEFLSWLYSSSPVKNTVVSNNRWGSWDSGDFSGGGDRYIPETIYPEKYECCYTMTKDCWCYDKTTDIFGLYSSKEILQQMTRVVATGGNFLLNIGPTAEGRITPDYEQRLYDIGNWMKINSQSVYETKPYKVPYDDNTKAITYTVLKNNNNVLYATFWTWPSSSVNSLTLKVPKATQNTVISLLGDSRGTKFVFENTADGLVIQFPTYVQQELPNQIGWVLKLENTN